MRMVDILSRVQGVNFDSAWDRRMDIAVDGEQVPVISSDDLIQSKLAAGRPMDLLDVDAIRETQKIVEQAQTVQEIQIEPELERDNDRER